MNSMKIEVTYSAVDYKGPCAACGKEFFGVAICRTANRVREYFHIHCMQNIDTLNKKNQREWDLPEINAKTKAIQQATQWARPLNRGLNTSIFSPSLDTNRI